MRVPSPPAHAICANLRLGGSECPQFYYCLPLKIAGRETQFCKSRKICLEEQRYIFVRKFKIIISRLNTICKYFELCYNSGTQQNVPVV